MPSSAANPNEPIPREKKGHAQQDTTIRSSCIGGAVRRRVVRLWRRRRDHRAILEQRQRCDDRRHLGSSELQAGWVRRLQGCQRRSVVSGSRRPRDKDIRQSERAAPGDWLKPDRSARYEGVEPSHRRCSRNNRPWQFSRHVHGYRKLGGHRLSRLGSLGGGSGQCRNS